MRDTSVELADANLPYNPDYAKAESYPPIPLTWPELKVDISFNNGEVRYTRTVVEP